MPFKTNSRRAYNHRSSQISSGCEWDAAGIFGVTFPGRYDAVALLCANGGIILSVSLDYSANIKSIWVRAQSVTNALISGTPIGCGKGASRIASGGGRERSEANLQSRRVMRLWLLRAAALRRASAHRQSTSNRDTKCFYLYPFRHRTSQCWRLSFFCRMCT